MEAMSMMQASLVRCSICGTGEPAYHHVCQDCAEKIMACYKPTTSSDFELWWSRYPEKVGKGKAREKYGHARKQATAQELLDGIAKYIANKPADRAFCHPATWLHQERWRDEYGSGATQDMVVSSDLDRKHVEFYVRTGKWLSTWGPTPTESTADPKVRRVYEEVRGGVPA
jgi:hypothetical protein